MKPKRLWGVYVSCTSDMLWIVADSILSAAKKTQVFIKKTYGNGRITKIESHGTIDVWD